MRNVKQEIILDRSNKQMQLGQALVSHGVLTRDQLSIALTEQSYADKPLEKMIVSLGFASEAIVRDVLGELLGRDSIDLSSVIPASDALELIPEHMARKLNILPVALDIDKNVLTIATADINNLMIIDKINAHLKGNVKINTLLAGETEIRNSIDQYYGYEQSIDEALREIEAGQIDNRNNQEDGHQESHPLVRLVDAMLSDAVKKGASDIHFEPEEFFIRIRYRLDGVLRQVRALHKNYWSAIAVRLKVLADINIAEIREPQDGRISLMISGRKIDFRVAAQPTMHGQNIVLRILDRQKGIMPLSGLGFSTDSQEKLRLMMAQPEGIVLVTGPTGSGKTTTLYSMLHALNSEARNIMTLEDPVEYPMTMIRQTSVNKATKLDFVNGMRSILRQDPDIILVGEVRDNETANMAFRAAMTGHQVYSTLHTNSAIGAIPRLLDIGVSPNVLVGNIIGVIAQRLVRLLCNDCKKPYAATDIEKILLGADTDKELMLYRAIGCCHCEKQGYKGQTALIEILRMDAELDEMIARNATMRAISNKAHQKGYVSLAEDGILKILSGQTSVDEVMRVVALTGQKI